jgi:hypothetical protein
VTTTAKGREHREPPHVIFDRINRRRAARAAAAASAESAAAAAAAASAEAEAAAAAAASAEAAAAAPPIDGSTVKGVPGWPDAGRHPDGISPAENVMADTFPRSATMRMLLRHPAIAAGVGVPAAVILLGSPAARRLLQVGLVLGTRPEVRAMVGAAVAVARDVNDARRRNEPKKSPVIRGQIREETSEETQARRNRRA